MMDEKDIRCEIGRSFPQYVTNFPEFDFLKAVENIFVQPYVKEWDFKTIKHIYGQGPVYIRTWYCLNSKLVNVVSRDPFSPQTMAVKTMKQKVINVQEILTI